ncbi:MAG: carbohydrate kinase [Chlorobi bacterium]|nr:carbohydrate kinase [Chlorobiota bacterium]
MENEQNQKRIFTFGETVYDIVFKNGKVISSNPGGAMLNSAVSLGRLGLPVSLISELGKDQIGADIIHFLNSNNVETKHIFRFSGGNTALALAFLDDENNANYDFYKFYPALRLDGKFPVVGENDVVLFGSFFALSPKVRKPLMNFLRQASKNKALIIYDPNIRKSNVFSNIEEVGFLSENIAIADIVRASDEDFLNIDPNVNSQEKAFRFIQERDCDNLIYTQNGHKVDFISSNFSFGLPVPKIKTISTIGAGDSFNAGLIFGLCKYEITLSNVHQINMETWKNIVKTAINFGSHVCTQMGNYISESFVKKNH